MSDLKALGYKLDIPNIQRSLSRFKDAMDQQLGAYAKLDVQWLETIYNHLYNLPDTKPEKTCAGIRTRSYRWRSGTKKNKPKYNWSKKRRARMGWKV